MPNEEVQTIVEQCHELQQGFDLNVFSFLSADMFQLENFHSKIIAQLLNPLQRHGRARAIMESLFNTLVGRARQLGKSELAQGLTDAWNNGEWYDGVRVATEYPATLNGNDGRIDIALLNDNDLNAIIIENKINDAPDMPRQLYRYVKALQNQRYNVLAVVYLKKFDEDVCPNLDENDWQVVQNLIIPISACKANAEYSLESCLRNTMGPDGTLDVLVNAFTDQYISFINGQNDNQSEWNTLCSRVGARRDEFLACCQDEIAVSVVNRIPEYICRRILYACPQCEFHGSKYYADRTCAAFNDYRINRIRDGEVDRNESPELGLDIKKRRASFVIEFFVRNFNDGTISDEMFRGVDDQVCAIGIGNNLFRRVSRGGRGCHVQYQIIVDETTVYSNVDDFIKDVATVIAKLSDAKEEMTRAMFDEA